MKKALLAIAAGVFTLGLVACEQRVEDRGATTPDASTVTTPATETRPADTTTTTTPADTTKPAEKPAQ